MAESNPRQHLRDHSLDRDTPEFREIEALWASRYGECESFEDFITTAENAADEEAITLLDRLAKRIDLGGLSDTTES